MPLPLFNWFDRDELEEQLASTRCHICGNVGAELAGLGARPHFIMVRCAQGCFLGYAAKAVAEPRTARRRRPPLPQGDFCWNCNKDKATLELLGLKLVGAHKRDRAALLDAGLQPDSPDEFMPLCEECHADVDRKRMQTMRIIAALKQTRREAGAA